jgi:metal-responsive CopG/Arc/MetJ family transcriptional regulator
MENKKQIRKYTTITIPYPLFKRISKRIENTGFSSVSDYVTYILRETIIDQELSKESKKSNERTVVNKLKALGYV